MYNIRKIFTSISLLLLALTFIILPIYGLPLLWNQLSEYIQPRVIADRKDTVQTFVQIIGIITQSIGGLLLLLNLYFASRTLRLNQEDQITNRFTQAINQLGATSATGKQVETRLGAIYALERIARDSDKDYWTILQILTAYVREHTHWNPNTEDKDTQLAQFIKEMPVLPIDIQAILTILKQRSSYQRGRELHPVDLGGCDLRLAQLDGIRLAGANLIGSRLVKASLRNAYLGPISLEAPRPEGDARLEEAWLHRVHFDNANLTRAHFDAACLYQAHLNNAILKEADLKHADLRQADLRGATLTNAILERADLRMADLRETNGLTQQQIDQAYTDQSTRLPPHIKPSRLKK